MRDERTQERDEHRKEKDNLNSKLDKLLSLTQKERIDTNLNQIQGEKMIKQIESLKLSEAKLKEKMKHLSKENTEYLRDIHNLQKKGQDTSDKYSVLKGNILCFTL